MGPFCRFKITKINSHTATKLGNNGLIGVINTPTYYPYQKSTFTFVFPAHSQIDQNCINGI